jgi:hypothetical protein
VREPLLQLAPLEQIMMMHVYIRSVTERCRDWALRFHTQNRTNVLKNTFPETSDLFSIGTFQQIVNVTPAVTCVVSTT